MPEKLYTTGEVAEVFGVSYVAVKKWAYAGRIKYIKLLAGSTDIPRARSEDFLASRCRKGRDES
jgi:predicted site-specific integrase-resolvase